jgi:hypothetical protein
MIRAAAFALLSLTTIDYAAACTCVSAVGANARTQMGDAAFVFRGLVAEVKLLPRHPEMRGRQRVAVTFRVNRYWKGAPTRTATLYDLDPGTDCHGFGYEAGKEYLVYASMNEARDYRLDKDYFWFGWTDILAPGTKILEPLSCNPGGLTSERVVRKALSELGRGNAPPLP